MVYYPTNAPIALNRHEINRALDETLRHFDPGGKAPASRDIVIIGHSMGGVLSRLLVSSSGEKLWDDLLQRYELRGERLKKVKSKLGPLLHFDARKDVGRAIFIAAPHRGTEAASKGFGRLVGKLVRLPVTILGKFGDVFEMLVDPNGDDGKPAKPRIPNSIDNLKSDDPFIRSAANLPLRPGPEVPFDRGAEQGGNPAGRVAGRAGAVLELAPGRRPVGEGDRLRAQRAGDAAGDPRDPSRPA
jgi:PGAP1-like protein.